MTTASLCPLFLYHLHQIHRKRAFQSIRVWAALRSGVLKKKETKKYQRNAGASRFWTCQGRGGAQGRVCLPGQEAGCLPSWSEGPELRPGRGSVSLCRHNASKEEAGLPLLLLRLPGDPAGRGPSTEEAQPAQHPLLLGPSPTPPLREALWDVGTSSGGAPPVCTAGALASSCLHLTQLPCCLSKSPFSKSRRLWCVFMSRVILEPKMEKLKFPYLL